MATIGLSTLKPEDLDIFLKISLGCFAIGLPTSCLYFLIRLERKYFGKSIQGLLTESDSRLLQLTSASLITPLMGVTCLFLHFSLWHGIIFSISLGFSWYCYEHVYTAIDREISQESQEEQK